MNQGNWLLLVLGCILILALYRRALRTNDISDLLSRDDYVDFHSRFSYYKALQQKSAFKSITVAFLVSYVLVVTNMVLDYVPGWWILGTVCFLSAYCYWIFQEITNRAYLAVETDTEKRDKLRKELDELQSYVVKFLIASVVVSSIWFYQVQRNQSAEKLTAINEVMNLVGLEWCANFSSEKVYMDADGNYENIGYGGWPCISVGSVRSINFTNKKDTLEMCFTYLLKQTSDGPWNRESNSEYDYRELCASDGDWMSNGWSNSSLTNQIREDFGNELDTLRSKKCSIYGRSMSYDDFSIYCN